MTYRTLHRSHERYLLVMFAVLLGAFIIAWAMMFVHPSVTLGVFWLALMFLGMSALVLGSMGRAERRTAKLALTRHACPWCGAEIGGDPGADSPWHCGGCGADFLDNGVEVTQGR